MLNNLKKQPDDKILALMELYREDPRDQKVDLGVGVYKNAEGVTPVMSAIKKAEKKLWKRKQQNPTPLWRAMQPIAMS